MSRIIYETSDISSKVSLCKEITFYNRFGDYIGRIASFVACIFLLMMFVKSKVS